jgi:L-gulono-1,4-lactone dehydrogenase
MKIGRREFMDRVLGTAGALALPAACAPCTYRTRYGWNNALEIGGVDPEKVAEPRSLAELAALVQRAEGEGATVRMVGAGHSFSDVAYSEGYLLLPWRLNRMLALERDRLKSAHADDRLLVRAEGGIRIAELNRALWADGLAMPILGGYDQQTLAGATATGTHGSSLSYGAIGDNILAFQVVTTGGQVLQVEPADGITDRAKFHGSIETPEGRIPARLEQDDDLYRALLVGLGCLGVVYAVIARVERRFWLREVRTRTTWGAVKGGFLRRLLTHVPAEGSAYQPERLAPHAPEDPVYYEIYVNPYPSKPGGSRESHRCILTERFKLPEKPTGLRPGDRKRGKFGMGVLDAMAELTGRGAYLGDYMNNNPSRVPAIIDDALEVLEDPSYVNRSYDVFNLGAANKVRAYGIEMGFDVRQSVEAVEAMIDHAARLARDGKRHSTPPSLRFARRSDAHLAMMQGRETMMLEMGMIVCAEGADDLLRHHEIAFLRDFGARPHWGLDLNILDAFAHVQTLFPETADRWHGAYRRLNEYGTFNGPFTDHLGISIRR